MNLLMKKPLHQITDESQGGGHTLKRTLSAASLVSLGIGAIIGAGLFSLTGIAAAENAGPAVVLSFVIAAVGCAFAGMCYSELAAMIPVAGSAYTYAYATMGELIAWVIGWDLVLEYAVGAATVAVSWSRYVVSFLHDLGIHLPAQLVLCPFEIAKLPDGTQTSGIVNLPAMLIICLVSLLLMRGIQESAQVNSVIVVIKVAVVLAFIGVGMWYVKMQNYVPYIPPNTGTFGEFGFSGVMRAAGVIFLLTSVLIQSQRPPRKRNGLSAIFRLESLGLCSFVLFSILRLRRHRGFSTGLRPAPCARSFFLLSLS